MGIGNRFSPEPVNAALDSALPLKELAELAKNVRWENDVNFEQKGPPVQISDVSSVPDSLMKAVKEGILRDKQRVFEIWLNSQEGQEAYDSGNLEALLQRLTFISGEQVKGTKFDPHMHYKTRPSFKLDVKTGEIGKKHHCNGFRIKEGERTFNLSAAHCLELLNNKNNPHLDALADIGSFAPSNEEKVVLVEWDPSIIDDDVHGKVVVSAGYDSADNFTNYDDGTKLGAGIAIKFNEPLIETLIGLWKARGEDVSDWKEGLLDKFFYLDSADRVNAGSGVSGSPFFLNGQKVFGLVSGALQIPKAEKSLPSKPTASSSSDDWIISYFPGPSEIRKFMNSK